MVGELDERTFVEQQEAAGDRYEAIRAQSNHDYPENSVPTRESPVFT